MTDSLIPFIIFSFKKIMIYLHFFLMNQQIYAIIVKNETFLTMKFIIIIYD
jgi:hypothetical protein